MNTDTYYIPVNFTNAGRILGLFEIRNLIEALLLCLPVLYVCLTYLPFSLTPKIIVTILLACIPNLVTGAVLFRQIQKVYFWQWFLDGK